MYSQFIHDLLPMLLDGFGADSQFGSNCFAGKTICNQLQGFHLPQGELARSTSSFAGNVLSLLFLSKSFGNTRAELCHPFFRCMKSFEKIFTPAVFYEVTRCSCENHLPHTLFIM